jgi:hypothetical protein
MQGHAVTSGRRDWSSLSLSTLCDHPRHCCTTSGTVTTSQCCWGATRRRHDGHCATYASPPVNGTLESAHYGGRTTNRCATTLEAAHVRAQDAPRCLNRSRIHQDGRQLHGTARHAATRREIMWHACKLLPPWPIKGGVVPQPRGEGTTDSNHSHALHFSPRYWRSPQSLPLGLGDQASSPTTLVAPLYDYEHHDARQYSASSTPMLDDGPDRNQDKPSVISC